MTKNDLGELVGTVWDAKTGGRTVRVESAQFSLGEDHLQISNLETHRTNRITLSGLRRKFVQRST